MLIADVYSDGSCRIERGVGSVVAGAFYVDGSFCGGCVVPGRCSLDGELAGAALAISAAKGPVRLHTDNMVVMLYVNRELHSRTKKRLCRDHPIALLLAEALRHRVGQVSAVYQRGHGKSIPPQMKFVDLASRYLVRHPWVGSVAGTDIFRDKVASQDIVPALLSWMSTQNRIAVMEPIGFCA
jgi:ribonuclease HI